MTDSSDGDVVRRVLTGDHDAFGILVDRYQDRLLAYVLYMGFGVAEAYDIVQDGYIRAFRHLRRCGDPDRFEGWLFRIVANLCRTAGKRRTNRATEPLHALGSVLEADGPGPEEQLDASLARARIRRALDAMPDDQREALVLMYLQGYSVQEIAERSGASVSAVKMRLKRGRDALRQDLSAYFPDAVES
jgi:RNA polymerase sigma-70 factor, ECF subfamily